MNISLIRIATVTRNGEEIPDCQNYGLRVQDTTIDIIIPNLFEEQVLGLEPAEMVVLARWLSEEAAEAIQFCEENFAGITISGEEHAWHALYAAGCPCRSPSPGVHAMHGLTQWSP